MKDVDEITVGANGSVYAAPTGSAVPASIAVPLSVAWVDLGYLSEDGVTATDSKTLEEIPVWQLFYVARRIVTARDLTLAFTLRQWARQQVEMAFGGGDVVEDVADAAWTYHPPAPEDIDERALAVEWQDGDKNYRWIVFRGMVTEDVETQIARANAMDLPITYGLLGDDAQADPWILQTDDPAFAPAA